jgi:hypothetical protein
LDQSKTIPVKTYQEKQTCCFCNKERSHRGVLTIKLLESAMHGVLNKKVFFSCEINIVVYSMFLLKEPVGSSSFPNKPGMKQSRVSGNAMNPRNELCACQDWSQNTIECKPIEDNLLLMSRRRKWAFSLSLNKLLENGYNAYFNPLKISLWLQAPISYNVLR